MLLAAGLLLTAPTTDAAAPDQAAQPDGPAWRPIGGPPGRISRLAASADGAALYAVSVALTYRQDDQTQWWAAGKAARSDALYWSRDGGASWQPATNDLPPAPITALYADERPAQVFVGTAAGLWLGRPNGEWTQLTLGRTGLNIRRIVRGADGRGLYVAATADEPYPTSYVYRSDDDGRTWTVSEPLVGDSLTSDILEDLQIAADDARRLFLITRAGRLLHSPDEGATWRVLETAALETAGATVPARLAFAAERPRTLLFVRSTSPTGMVVERSEDGGASWRRLSATGLPATAQVGALTGLRGDVFLLSCDRGAYRSVDGGATWQPLEGALSSGGVAEFLPWPAQAEPPAGRSSGADSDPVVLAATGYGVFISWDGGALWQARSVGLPVNSRIVGLLVGAGQPGSIWALTDARPLAETAPPPLVLRSLDGGRTWSSAARGLPAVTALAWTTDAAAPDAGLLIAARQHFLRTGDAGLTWQVTALPEGNHTALAATAADPQVIYLGGRPALRSADRGQSWQPMPVTLPGQESQTGDVTALAVDPADADHVWAGLDDGVLESTDGGRTWRAAGLAGQPVRWLQNGPGGDAGPLLYAGVAEGGLYRLDSADGRWSPASTGLPARSTLLGFWQDPGRSGWLWATRDGGGVYRSTDGGDSWTNVTVGLGDTLATAITAAPTDDAARQKGDEASVLIGAANAGVWVWRPAGAADPTAPRAEPPTAFDARIELVWPHGGAGVTEAQRANIGLRIFARHSLEPAPCGWSSPVVIWQAMNNSPAELLAEAVPRAVDGQPFPFWELNNVDVSRATDTGNKIYFMVRSNRPDLATSIWAHGADPRTYFPQQDVPSGLATAPIGAIDARIQIVWPHDGAGNERPPAEATHINVAVVLFKHGTRLSVPVGWQPPGMTLYGAWNHQVGRPLTRAATPTVRTAGVVTYPAWEFNNVPAAQARDGTNRLYLWVQLDDIETYPNIWAHGADARTIFPKPDEPIRGCNP